jgi:hypothetical protein
MKKQFDMKVSESTIKKVTEIQKEYGLGSRFEAIRKALEVVTHPQMKREIEYMAYGEGGVDFRLRQKHTLNRLFVLKVTHLVKNYQRIEDDMQGDPLPIMARLEAAFTGEPAIVLGSGPSLDKSLPLLKDWKGRIFCGPTQLHYCLKLGITPDIVLAYDPNPNLDIHMAPQFNDYSGLKLITNPFIDPELIKWWNGERYYYIPSVPMQKSQVTDLDMTVEEWITGNQIDASLPLRNYFQDSYTYLHREWMKMLYFDNPKMRGGIKPPMYASGCTPNQNAIIAHWMGCEPIFLVGVDYAYLNGCGSSLRHTWSDGEWKESRSPMPKVVTVSDGKLPTNHEMLSYKVSLLHLLIQKTPYPNIKTIQCFLCAEDNEYGILSDVLDTLSTHEVVEREGRGYEDLYNTVEEWTEIANGYMSTHAYGRFISNKDTKQLVDDAEDEGEFVVDKGAVP